MSALKYLEYRNTKNYEFDATEKSFITFIGKSNDFILDSIIKSNSKTIISIEGNLITDKNRDKYKRFFGVVLWKHLNLFLGETLRDEIAFGLESLGMKKHQMRRLIEVKSKEFKIEELLDRDPCSLGSSDKAKVKILSALICKPKILVLDNVLDELDYEDKTLVLEILKKYVEEGNIILNFTSNVEESLSSIYLVISDEEKIVISGKTLSVLNEEKLMKRLGIYTPFIVELNKYFMDYNLIEKYELDVNRLVGKLWK